MKTSEAANLAFQWIFSVKNKFFHVSIVNRTLLNILKNFVPGESIECAEKDPAWFNKKVKSLIKKGKFDLIDQHCKAKLLI